ncbi:LamG domain-containing protein [Streptomyces sp. NPDC056291]|uniref:LamG domain-containing protein n=1 Tax=Streptomyces sp. NPDC056291 TaxID=3345772 RepID=UPI0035D67B1D
MVCVLAALVAMPSLPGQVAYAAPAEADSAPMSEGQRALTEAQQSGQRVEVTGERTERTTVYANPDGFTFTLEESAVPVRAAKPGGGWQAPDATLEKRPDGSVGPKAAAVGMAFSPGGDAAPLARIADQGASMEIGWPGKLPAPQLDGPSAVYADVLPGVDLKVTATLESFQPVFVVKTPEAAASDKLKKLTFSLKAHGLTVREGAAGNLAAVDANGRTVFKSPPARMWDSAGEASGTQAQWAVRKTAASGVGEPSDPSEAAPTGSGLEPGQGDAVAPMDVQVTNDSLSVVPDAEMLTKTDASAFPLFIDPTVTWGESERTLLRSDGYESYGWGNGDDGLGKGVGKCGTWNGYYCGPGYVQRLYFEFSPASLKGKSVLDATFRVTEPWAFQCSPRWVDLVRTNNISSSTTWSTRPKELDLMVGQNVSAGRGSLCDPNSPAAPIEFHDDPAKSNENLTPTVKDFAAGKFSRLTLQIRARDESDTSAWKRFKNDAVLSVKYVGVPATPTEVGVVSGSSYVCSTNSGHPSIVADPTPLVQGRPRTVAGGESGANLRIRWRTEKYDGAAWVLAHTDLDGPTSGYVGNLVKQSRKLPTLKEGVNYRLKALTLSYYEGGTNQLNTGYTTPCYFKVDPTAPKAPQVTIGSPYTECTTNDCVARGAPGQSATFTFKAAAGDTNNVAYEYSLSSGSTWASAKKVCAPQVPADLCAGLGEDNWLVIGWQAVITPDHGGVYRLTVRAKDNVGTGRYGASTVVDFAVHSGAGPIGRWHFSEASGLAVDSAAPNGMTGHDATLAGGAIRDNRGRRGVLTHDAQGQPLDTPVTDLGLSLNGTTGYASTASKVLETRTSYTVSTWVRLSAAPTRNLTVLSQNGTHRSPFYLGYENSSGTWALRATSQDAPVGGSWSYQKVAATAVPTIGTWTHLTGVYDAQKQEIRLYVNGKLQGSAPYTTAWAATGPLQIGRTFWSDTYTDFFNGSVDEVAVWQRALSSKEISDEARLAISDGFNGVELVANWSADQGSGRSVPDTVSGYGRSLTLAGGASLDGEAIVLNGVDAAATTPGPVVDDTGSFTVTALASLDGDELATKTVGYTGQVLGQRAADGSAWGLWYELTEKKTVLDEDTFEEKTVPHGFWRFGRLNADGTFSAVASDESALLDGMVRLTGVFDAQAGAAGTISLHLGYVQNGEPSAFTAKVGSGHFGVGGFAEGAWGHFLPGQVAEVRLWAGAMADGEQIEETVGD